MQNVLDPELRSWVYGQPRCREGTVYRATFDRWDTPRLLRVTATGVRLIEIAPVDKHHYNLTWGYGGAGPTNLKGAILADALDVDIAEIGIELRAAFELRFGANWEQDQGWELPRADILSWLETVGTAPAH